MSEAPRVGRKAPDPRLVIDGAPTTLHTWRAGRPLLVVFLRHLA